jgi:hypothetical protein
MNLLLYQNLHLCDLFLVTMNNTDIPPLIKDLPMRITRSIINLMNYMECENDWMQFAMRIWPEMTNMNGRFLEENGKMEQVLEKWGNEKGTTNELLSILRDMGRIDVLIELKKEYPSIG